MLCSWAELRRFESSKVSFQDEGAEFALRKESPAGSISARIHGQDIPREDMITIGYVTDFFGPDYGDAALQGNSLRGENAVGGPMPTSTRKLKSN